MGQAAAYAHDGGDSTPLYAEVMKQLNLTQFNEVIGCVYDKNKDNYACVASLAPLALTHYGDCKIAKGIVDQSVEQLVKRILLVIKNMYGIKDSDCHGNEKKTEEEGKEKEERGKGAEDKPSLHTKQQKVSIICSGSLLTKSPLYFELVKKQLNWMLGHNPLQSYLNWIIPHHPAEYGAALHCKHEFDIKFLQNIQQFEQIFDQLHSRHDQHKTS
ncbi:hypothetical protein RFI_26655 [Reticulomyxa filosa]|uniref:Uncharacterized protein n=1 Tax=Reticulomyxa filosa TaxID=46433 RepID=X6MAN5_RETFI|nr:hypothetical protein RFI_26655 [Reticulomyxa filosa]|eukprot:ETO10721.1 hypothetical protein RFI_26655 [Reticulomyxa filosa]